MPVQAVRVETFEEYAARIRQRRPHLSEKTVTDLWLIANVLGHADDTSAAEAYRLTGLRLSFARWLYQHDRIGG